MKKMILTVLFITCIVMNSSVFATSWWQDAWNFGQGQGTADITGATAAIDSIKGYIKTAGNMLFIVITTILGIKYIWGGVESKTSVKDSLITLVIAAIFFYGYSTIEALFDVKNFFGSNFDTSAQKIYSTVLYICNFFAVGGIVYIGVRYLMTGAEGKAELKAKGVPIVLGIIMVYATITFLNFIVSIV